MDEHPNPERSSRRPFQVLALVLLGLVGFWALVCAGLMAHPRSRAMIDAAVGFGSAVAGGMDAPGTDALRALGCDEAIVLEVGQAAAFVSELDASAAELSPELAATPWVMCRQPFGSGSGPSCEMVARAYATAVRPEGRFLAVVHEPGETGCSGYFGPAGEFLGDMGPNFELVER